MRLEIISIILILTISCVNSERANEKKIDSIKIEENNHQRDIEMFSEEICSPIEIEKLLNLEFLETTAGVLSPKESKKFCTQKETGFFGSYTLIQRDEKNENSFIGYLTIFTTDKPEKWRQDSKNQKFIEIELHHPTITLWEKIKVGISERELLKFIGNNFHYKKGKLIYSEIKPYTCEFEIESELVKSLKVGIYCKDEK